VKSKYIQITFTTKCWQYLWWAKKVELGLAY